MRYNKYDMPYKKWKIGLRKVAWKIFTCEPVFTYDFFDW